MVHLDRLLNPVPTLSTERLRLRDIQLTDAEALFAVFGDAEAMTYYGEDVPHTSHQQTHAMIQSIKDYQVKQQAIRWAITLHDNDIAIGTIGFYKFDQAAAVCELGYDLNRNYWRQGIMSEVLGRVLQFAFDDVGLNRIEAGTDGDNQRSQGLLRKMGFVYEGTFRQKLFYKERYWDEHWFAMLKSDFDG